MKAKKKTFILGKDSSPTELMYRFKLAQLVRLKTEIKELEEKLKKEIK